MEPSEFSRPIARPFNLSPRRYAHVLKMLSVHVVMIGAFSDTIATVPSTPWSPFWPTLLFQPTAVIWIAVLILRRRRRPPPAAA